MIFICRNDGRHARPSRIIDILSHNRDTVIYGASIRFRKNEVDQVLLDILYKTVCISHLGNSIFRSFSIRLSRGLHGGDQKDSCEALP